MTFSLRAAAVFVAVVVAGIVVFTASVERKGGRWCRGECLVRGRVRIEFSTQYKNQQCVRTLYVCVCVGEEERVQGVCHSTR